VKKRVAVLVSGRGANMAALIEAAANPGYPAAIVLVVSNRPDAAAIGKARAAGIAATAIDHKDFASREAHEAAIEAALREARIDLVALAGYMRVLTGDFVRRHSGRLVNIHPSLLPAFRGTHTHERALQAGAKRHGASVHFVTEGVDEGPVIAQAAVPVFDGDSADMLAARVLEAELKLYPAALALVAAGKARLQGGRTVYCGLSQGEQAALLPAGAP
jgi:phosphoribosylglycinamide formyltransferase-1